MAIGLISVSTGHAPPPFKDVNGWTVFPGSPDTKKIYVSNAGSNSNNGLSPATPVQTIQFGYGLLRDGFPDWLLINKGDTFINDIPGNSGGTLRIGGRSIAEPMVITTYGTGARPIIKWAAASFVNGMASFSLIRGRNYAFTGLEFRCMTRDPNDAAYIGPQDAGGNPSYFGFGLHNPTGYFLIEDCYFSSFTTALATPTGVDIIEVNRCVFVDQYAGPTGPHSQGIAGDSNAYYTVTECVFDHNGWIAAGPLTPWGVSSASAPNQFNHNFYLQGSLSGSLMSGNICLNDGTGCQFRGGGIMHNNFWSHCGYPTNMGNGVVGVSDYNVCIEGVDTYDAVLSPTGVIAQGFSLGNGVPLSGSIMCSNNIIANTLSAFPASNFGINVFNASVTGVSILNNIIYKWNGAATGLGNSTVPGIQDFGTGTVISGNQSDLAGANTFGYPDPNNATCAAYSAHVGGAGTFADFVAKCRAQSKDTWDPNYTAAAINNWMRGKFGIAPI